MSNRTILLSALNDPRVLAAIGSAEYQGPSLGDEVKKLQPDLEAQFDLALQSRQVMRHYSLTMMLRQSGIRRSISRTCACGKTISANKTHCARCIA